MNALSPMAAADTKTFAIQAASALASAELDCLDDIAHELADAVAGKHLTKAAAVDLAYTIAKGAGVVRRWGDDPVQELLSEAFGGVE